MKFCIPHATYLFSQVIYFFYVNFEIKQKRCQLDYLKSYLWIESGYSAFVFLGDYCINRLMCLSAERHPLFIHIKLSLNGVTHLSAPREFTSLWPNTRAERHSIYFLNPHFSRSVGQWGKMRLLPVHSLSKCLSQQANESIG